jgi:hypothetical protein
MSFFFLVSGSIVRKKVVRSPLFEIQADTISGVRQLANTL